MGEWVWSELSHAWDWRWRCPMVLSYGEDGEGIIEGFSLI